MAARKPITFGLSLASKCSKYSSISILLNGYSPTATVMRRNFSDKWDTELPPAKTGTVASKDETRKFLSVFPDLVQDLTSIGKTSELVDANKWHSKVLQYNVQGGKMNRGLTVYLSLKEFMPADQLSDEIVRKALILGWCIEMLQSHFLIADDIIDNSSTRRGKECWYRKEKVGLAAFNDSLFLNASVYKLLHMHCKDELYYVDMIELFHDVSMKTILGQCLDIHSCHSRGEPNFDKFTMQQYNAIVKFKTAYYSFYLPVALSMYMAGIRNTDYARVAGITDRELHRQAKTILLEMGSFFQVQDDYLDCFGNPLVTGKVGSDISEGKCTWLAVVALQRASNVQRTVFKENYGKSDQQNIDCIRELYKELGLQATYKAYEESTASLIRVHIQQISRGLNHNVFFKFLEKIHKRST